MNELMKLDAGYCIKKKTGRRRQSIETFKKECEGIPQPSDLDACGIDVPVKLNFAYAIRDGHVTEDVLRIMKQDVNSDAILIPKIRLCQIPFIGYSVQLNTSHIKIPKNSDIEGKIIDEKLQSVFEQLKTSTDIAVGFLSHSSYSIHEWQRVTPNSSSKLKDAYANFLIHLA